MAPPPPMVALVGGWNATEAPATMANATAAGAFDLAPVTTLVVVACYAALVFVTVCGNLLVIGAFAKEPTLQAITNYWIVSLSLTDIILACTVMPLQMARELKNGQWVYGDLACDIFICLDVLCCTCSIYHLMLISLDRYFLIRFPIIYPTIRTSSRTILAILLTWLWCCFISMPRFIGMKDPPRSRQCNMTNKTYMVFSSLVSFYVPLALILAMYAGIYRATQARARRFRRDLAPSVRVRDYMNNVGAQPSPNRHLEAGPTAELEPIPEQTIGGSSDSHSTIAGCAAEATSPHSSCSSRRRRRRTQKRPRRAASARPAWRPRAPSLGPASGVRQQLLLNVRRIGAMLTHSISVQSFVPRSRTAECVRATAAAATAATAAAASPPPPAADCSTTSTRLFDARKSLPTVAVAAGCDSALLAVPAVCEEDGISASVDDIDESAASTASQCPSAALANMKATFLRSKTDLDRRHQLMTRNKLQRRRQKQEHRTARIVVIVLGAFVIFWGPFFIVNLVAPLCTQCHVADVMWKWVVFWGYVNSAVNPFIYTFFNRTFRRAILSVIKCERKRRR